MLCPFCRHKDTKVIDSRNADEGRAIRRRRECGSCGERFSTNETAELVIIKRGGAMEPFSRHKVVSGVRKACQGRPVSDADLALLAQKVEDALRATGSSQVDAADVGVAILPFLKDLDQVAYLRFASVYENFESLADFEAAIRQLRASHPENPAPTKV